MYTVNQLIRISTFRFNLTTHWSTNLSVIRTLFHRADTVVTDPEDQDSEKEHVKSALRRCGYENWSFKRAYTKKQQTKTNKQTNKKQKQKKNQKVATEADSSKFTTKKTFVVAPYVQGSQKMWNACSTTMVSAHASNHIKLFFLLHPRTKPRSKNSLVSLIVYLAGV